MFEHVTLRTLFFCNQSKMIIPNSEALHTVFCSRASVHHNADEDFRSGKVVCPDCGGQLKINLTYSRHYKDSEGEKHDGWVAQGYCRGCNSYHSALPDFLMPHKHYEASVIEAALAEAEEKGSYNISSCHAWASTVRRWDKQFRERGADAAGWLLSILFTVYDRCISVIKLHEKWLLKQLAIIAKEFPAASGGGAIGRVNIVLTGHKCGFL